MFCFILSFITFCNGILYLYLQVHSYFQFGQGILMRKSSFGFNVTSLEGRNEGPGMRLKASFLHNVKVLWEVLIRTLFFSEAELKITFPSRSLMDLVSIIVAVLLLLGVITVSSFCSCFTHSEKKLHCRSH